VIIIRKNTEIIHELSRNFCCCLRDIPYDEAYSCIEEAIHIFETCRFYSREELNRIAEEQLENLKHQMRVLNFIETDSIIRALRLRKSYAIEHALKEPIAQNSIPMLPVIGIRKLSIDVQMQLLKNNGKCGQSKVPLDRIKSYLEEDADFYWLVNVAPSPRYSGCYFLNIAEAIAYSFHTGKFSVKSLNSRYKYKHHEPALCVVLYNERPILCWANNVPSFTEMIEPNAIYRLIH